jgi:hypothetical protein
MFLQDVGAHVPYYMVTTQPQQKITTLRISNIMCLMQILHLRSNSYIQCKTCYSDVAIYYFKYLDQIIICGITIKCVYSVPTVCDQ